MGVITIGLCHRLVVTLQWNSVFKCTTGRHLRIFDGVIVTVLSTGTFSCLNQPQLIVTSLHIMKFPKPLHLPLSLLSYLPPGPEAFCCFGGKQAFWVLCGPWSFPNQALSPPTSIKLSSGFFLFPTRYSAVSASVSSCVLSDIWDALLHPFAHSQSQPFLEGLAFSWKLVLLKIWVCCRWQNPRKWLTQDGGLFISDIKEFQK